MLHLMFFSSIVIKKTLLLKSRKQNRAREGLGGKEFLDLW